MELELPSRGRVGAAGAIYYTLSQIMQQLLTFLPLLLCPLMMGACIWMMRRNKSAPPQPATLDELRTEQARLAARVAEFESAGDEAAAPAAAPVVNR
ncbi:MAG: hypothetical protein H0U42_09080 [Thermoleophilaceae bacterium]|nr:hypothetical protein [Thermoleophilaceae bacterium]